MVVGTLEFQLFFVPEIPLSADVVPVDPGGSSDDGDHVAEGASVVDLGYGSAIVVALCGVLRVVGPVTAVELLGTHVWYPVPFPTVVHGVEAVPLICRPRVVLAERVKRDVECGVISAVVVVHITGDLS